MNNCCLFFLFSTKRSCHQLSKRPMGYKKLPSREKMYQERGRLSLLHTHSVQVRAKSYQEGEGGRATQVDCSTTEQCHGAPIEMTRSSRVGGKRADEGSSSLNPPIICHTVPEVCDHFIQLQHLCSSSTILYRQVWKPRILPKDYKPSHREVSGQSSSSSQTCKVFIDNKVRIKKYLTMLCQVRKFKQIRILIMYPSN